MGKKILIVDDAKFIRDILVQYFERKQEGFKIEEAENGKEAIEKYQSFKPDLVFMDIVMPELSGIEATKEIIKLNPEALILGLSTMDEGHIIDKLLQAGAKSFFKKPFSIEDLDQALSEHL